MNREIIKEENRWLLEAITEQYEALYRFGDHVPRIESDILMENVRQFYENLHRLQRLGETPLTTEPPAFSRPEYPVPDPEPASPAPPPAAITETVLTPAPGITVTISDPKPVTPPAEIVSEPEPEPIRPPSIPFKPAGPGRTEPTRTSGKAAPTPEMDLFANEEPTFSIKLKEAREKSLGPKGTSARIDNLKAAITINEKFMFINELFDGNLREYNETVETLNGLQNLQQASEFLDLMRKKNFWNTGSNAFRKLTELVERRF